MAEGAALAIAALAAPVAGIVITFIQVGIYQLLIRAKVLPPDGMPPPPVLLLRSMIVVLALGAVMAVTMTVAQPPQPAAPPAGK
jgi:hypothetical protein